ncbi:hydrogenase maturation protein [Bacillus sp. V3B]|uniref:hydrogenase maturation protein n=1 Tax=Bacillus sp. V3B TaxID=2804915 RepID=UPI00210CD5F8|nr:enoyl-CoA hydratase-related protein [Bacillus sp. V3B]MCQ6275522.1 hydrogenase maturation protein [Bacillus sp. V3B]
MRILFITSAHNSMSQRSYVELTDRGHCVEVQLATSEYEMSSAVERFNPDLIVAPFLKTAIPETIWTKYICIIIHPGIKGDRGPYSLDWAIMNNEEEWGVTLLQANHEMDAGDIWSTKTFKVRNISKSHLYRHEVTQAAMKCLLETITKFESESFVPEPLDYLKSDVKGQLHPKLRQADRKLDWTQQTDVIIRKIRAADSNPGVLDTIFDEEYYVFGVHEESDLKGNPGEILAMRDGAICRATGNGAVWITHLKEKNYFKLSATSVLKDKLTGVPELPLTPFEKYPGRTFREIFYEERNEVGYLHFNFYNGAMSTDQCNRLKQAFIEAKQRNTKAIVLMGGSDFWSNGIHLNVIENAENPGGESWNNINGMDDLVREIILTDSHLVISSMQGNAGAGGVILALAADYVYAREGIVLNPHYKKMGGLYGSEYWTYLLPKRVGYQKAKELMEDCLPVSTTTAKSIGLIDDTFGETAEEFCLNIRKLAEKLIQLPEYKKLLLNKIDNRTRDEIIKSLEIYRNEELEHMWKNFFGEDRSYHIARYNFVYKISCLSEQMTKI